MKHSTDLKVNYKGKNIDAHLWADDGGIGKWGIALLWYVEIYINGNSHLVQSISEYPQGIFTEINREVFLTTPINTFTDLILTCRQKEEKITALII